MSEIGLQAKEKQAPEKQISQLFSPDHFESKYWTREQWQQASSSSSSSPSTSPPRSFHKHRRRYLNHCLFFFFFFFCFRCCCYPSSSAPDHFGFLSNLAAAPGPMRWIQSGSKEQILGLEKQHHSCYWCFFFLVFVDARRIHFGKKPDPDRERRRPLAREKKPNHKNIHLQGR